MPRSYSHEYLILLCSDGVTCSINASTLQAVAAQLDKLAQEHNAAPVEQPSANTAATSAPADKAATSDVKQEANQHKQSGGAALSWPKRTKRKA